KKFETRIFIMRKNHNTRSFDSPDSLIMELFNHNIKGYYLEDLSFHDQVALFNQVDLVIAPHGAGLSNILFCHEKVKIIELMPENDIRLTYYKLASTLCLDYSCCKIKVNLNNQFEAQNIIENLPALMQTNQ
ncbi:MAG: glycosyltransferase family 61 protein, partial [Fulvivirga sp.]|uniref:glycosyltransferase family 61 protein n=1 Tax=Fulvivirga sp. TaxID=1931237 RepID=UPI0032EE7A71